MTLLTSHYDLIVVTLRLQAGEEYARRAEAKELARFAALEQNEKTATETTAPVENKKDQ